MNYEYHPITPSTYVSPLPAGEFHFLSPFDIYNKNGDVYKLMAYYKQTVIYNDVPIFEKTIYGAVIPIAPDDTNIYDQDLSGYNGIISSGIYRVEYEFGASAGDGHGGFVEDFPPLGKCSYEFYVVENQYPMKKKTIKDVVERNLLLIEPLVAYGYNDLDEEQGKQAASRLIEITNEQVDVAAALFPDENGISQNDLQKNIKQYFDELSSSINNSLLLEGDKIDFYKAVLYLLKQKYKLKNKDMAYYVKYFNEKTMKDFLRINTIKPQ